MSWTGTVSLEDACKAADALLVGMVENSCCRIVIDCSLLGGLWPGQEWFVQNWIKRASRVGLTDLVVVMSDNILTQLSLQSLARRCRGVINLHIFTTAVAARKWYRNRDSFAA